MKKERLLFRSSIIFAILIYLFSFGLRFWKLQHISPFSDDMARDAFVVLRHMRDKEPFVLGPKASAGNFYVQPFYYYMMTIPLWLSRGNPESASVMVVVLESFTPVLLYIIGRRYWSERAGQIMGGLYAISPLTITFGSNAWSPNLVPLFSTLMLLCVFERMIRGSRWAVVGAVVAAMIAFQMHYQAAILFLFLGGVFLVDLFRTRGKGILWWIIAGLCALVTLLPLLFDVGLTLQNIDNILHFAFVEQKTVFQTVRTFPFFWNTMSRFFERAVGVESDGHVFGRIFYLGGIGLLAGRSLMRILREKRFLIQADHVFLWFLLASFIGLRLYKGDKLEYYLLFLFPSASILFGAIFAYVRGFALQLTTLFVLAISLNAAVNYPVFVDKPQHDYDSLRRFVRVMDQEVPQPYIVAAIPYRYYRDPLLFAWLSEKGRAILEEKGEPGAYHVYLCSPEQQCGSNPYGPVEGEYSEVNLKQYISERQAGYVLVKHFRFQEENIALDVAVYGRRQ